MRWRLAHCGVPFGAGVRLGAKGRWLDVGAPRPHAPRQGAQALHRGMELVCRASFGYSECAKIAKNLSPFLAADFSLFCHGSARGGPDVPRTPLRRAGALPVALWSGSRAVGVSSNANGVIYVQATQHSPHPSVQTGMHSSGSWNWRQPPPAHSAHTEQRRQAFISRVSGAHHTLPWSPSGDTYSSPAYRR